MSSFLKVLGRDNDRSIAARSEMHELADRVQKERKAFERLIARAGDSSTELDKLAEPIRKMGDRLGALERQMGAIERRAPAVATAQEQAEGLLKAHGRIETQLGDSGNEVARIRSELGELGRLVESATGLKADLAKFLESGGPFRALRSQADELQTWMNDLAGTCGRLRERQESLEHTSKLTASRLQAVEGASQAATGRIETYQKRVEELEQTIGTLGQVAAGATDTKRQLLTLKSLADQVTQKAAALENQRDAMERVTKDVSRIDDLVQRVDAAIREQENQILNLHTLTSEVEDVRSLYESVTTQSQEINARQREIEERERATREKLADLGEQLQGAAERFDLEHRGLETVNHRITDLRAAVTSCEEQTSRLEASTGKVNELGTKVDAIWNRVGFLMTDLAKLDEQTHRMRILRADAHRIRDLMQESAARSAEIEKGKPAVEAIARDLAALSGTHEAVKSALDQLRGAQEEVTRVRSSQVETEAWLKAVREPVIDLQARVQQLDALKPTVEAVQKRVEWVAETMETVTAHRQFLDQMETRLAELAALGAQLDDRTKAFRSRMDVAEGRFLLVTRQAEEAERIATLVPAICRTATEADNRLQHLTRSISSYEGRSKDLESVAERARLLGRELDERQGALDRASEHLARASALRQEAADAARLLDQQVRTAETTLDTVEDRTKRLEILSEELDGRSTELRRAEKSMAQFEAHLVKWELAKQELQLCVDQVATRQSTVDALKADLQQMFEIAESTANTLRASTAMQRDVQQSTPTLEDLLQRLRDADTVAAAVDLRKHEIEQAERRLARAEAVLIDIQSSLETLHMQKAILDQVIEKAGSLTFQVQQGEALIDRMRKERDVTNSVRIALEDSGNRPSRSKRGGT